MKKWYLKLNVAAKSLIFISKIYYLKRLIGHDLSRCHDYQIFQQLLIMLWIFCKMFHHLTGLLNFFIEKPEYGEICLNNSI